MRRGKTAGMLAAFQGFTASHGGKKARQDVQVIVSQLLMIFLHVTCRVSLSLGKSSLPFRQGNQ